MADGPALHEDDRMVSVFARNSGGESCDESSLGLSHNLLEAVCRDVVALVDDDQPWFLKPDEFFGPHATVQRLY